MQIIFMWWERILCVFIKTFFKSYELKSKNEQYTINLLSNFQIPLVLEILKLK